MRIKCVIACAVVLLLAVSAFFIGKVLRSGESSADSAETGVSQVSRRIADAEQKAKPSARSNAQHPKPVLDLSEEDDDDEESKRTPAEKKLAADIENALDVEDFELAKKCAPLALNCKDTEIRQAMVDTLAWFGAKAIPELTPFIADPDADVAESAMNEWDSAVSSVEDDGEKIGMTELAMSVISNEDDLESISGNYIGVDEKLAVESLLRVIEGGGSANGVAKAKETYEFVTGETFTDRAAAEKWIAEEYEPPESGE